MAKVIFIGDVHGREFWKDAISHVDEYDHVIFCGDYADPYPDKDAHMDYEGIMENMEEIIEFKKAHMDKVILMIGNHDQYYWYPQESCSRHDYEHEQDYHRFFIENKDFFTTCKVIDDVLFSHAGLAVAHQEAYGIEKDRVEEILNRNFFEEDGRGFFDVGHARWGNCPVGSITWSDLGEDKSTDWFQVFGHTQLREKPYIVDNIACLDVKRCFVVDTQTHEICEL